MIEVKNISKTFNRNSNDPVIALVDVSLKLAPKSFTVVVGSNGSGKSTLLNALAGTIRVDAGQIFMEGENVTALRDYERSRWIARIFQNPLMGTAPELTVLENFRLAALRTHSKKLKTGTDEKFIKSVKEKVYILALGLESKLHQKMGSLSGGQRQALTLLMATMDDTKVLLMDEPTAALDPKTSELILKLADRIIREYSLTVLFVTHQLKDALHYGDRIIRMNEGKIVQDVTAEAKSKMSIGDVYQWFE
jgi:putative ABC transport system ATP-binding protein